jgi:beta-alanine degradation protein BauB
MTTKTSNCTSVTSRRQALALLAALGVSADAMAQDALTSDPRSFNLVLENDRVRVLEFKSGPGLGVCGQGMHYHPAHVTVSLTGAKLKRTSAEGKVTFDEIEPGRVLFDEAQTHSAEVIGGFKTRTYIIELKGKDWKPSTG